MKGDWDEVEEKTRKKGTGGGVGNGEVQGVGRARRAWYDIKPN